MIVDIQLKTQLRIAGEKIGQKRRNQLHRGKMSAGYAQRSAGDRSFTLPGDLIRQLRQGARFLQYLFPRSRERQLTGRAMNQSGASPLLHLFQIAAHHRPRHPQRPRGGA